MIVAVKTVIWLLCLAPLGSLLFLGLNNQLGPDPGKALVDNFGLWALRFLLITLTLRPLREISGKSFFIQVRRLLGLFSWFYASLHFSAAIIYVIGWSMPELIKALSEKTYIVLGLVAWLMLLPLGVTSNRWSQRKLGRRWQRLHRFIYPLTIFACLHFVWLVRSDYWQPLSYALFLVLLLLWRTPIARRFLLSRAH